MKRRGKGSLRHLWSWSTEGQVAAEVRQPADGRFETCFSRGLLAITVRLERNDLPAVSDELELRALVARDAERAAGARHDGDVQEAAQLEQRSPVRRPAKAFGLPGKAEDFRLIIETSDGSAQLFWLRMRSAEVDAAFYLNWAAALLLARDLRSASAEASGGAAAAARGAVSPTLIEEARAFLWRTSNTAEPCSNAAFSDNETVNQSRAESCP
jgi:hypothetical protein